MSHEAFRILIPGLIFYFPTIAAAAFWQPDKVPVLATVLATVVLPTGWLLYSGFRVLRIQFHRTYEKKSFIGMLRNRLRAIYVPFAEAVVIDFSDLRSDCAKWKLPVNLFTETFCPFRRRARGQRLYQDDVNSIPFLEHLSDLSMFQEPSYDYARSISSVRYGLSCSGFALILGVALAVGLTQFVGSEGYGKLVGGMLTSIVPLLLLYMLCWQRVYCSAEYDARLNLITLSRFGLAEFNDAELNVGDLQDILDFVDTIENPGQREAIFDLDNTLLIGDIQEALLARLILDGKLHESTFETYLQALEQDPARAYRMAVQAMAGLRLHTVELATREILHPNAPCSLSLPCATVRTPRPHPSMQMLVSRLQLMRIDCVVVSASYQQSVEVSCWEHFGIPKYHAYGIRAKTRLGLFGKTLTSDLEEPLPSFEGKAEILKLRASRKTPILMAGDSKNDYAMVRCCVPDAKVLWVGKEAAEVEAVEKELDLSGRVRFVMR